MADKTYVTRTSFKRDGKRHPPGTPVTLDSVEGDDLVKRKVLVEGGTVPRRSGRRGEAASANTGGAIAFATPQAGLRAKELGITDEQLRAAGFETGVTAENVEQVHAGLQKT